VDQDNANSLLKDYHLQQASPCIDLGNDYSKTDDIGRIGTRPVDGPNNTGTGDYDVIAEGVMGVDEFGQWTVISKPSFSLISSRNSL
jgi:hypothetical protein